MLLLSNRSLTSLSAALAAGQMNRWTHTHTQLLVLCGGTTRSEISVFSGPSAGEGRLSGGGVGKLQEGQTRLPLHRSAPLCQDEEDSSGVSPQ